MVMFSYRSCASIEGEGAERERARPGLSGFTRMLSSLLSPWGHEAEGWDIVTLRSNWARSRTSFTRPRVYACMYR